MFDLPSYVISDVIFAKMLKIAKYEATKSKKQAKDSTLMRLIKERKRKRSTGQEVEGLQI